MVKDKEFSKCLNQTSLIYAFFRHLESYYCILRWTNWIRGSFYKKKFWGGKKLWAGGTPMGRSGYRNHAYFFIWPKWRFQCIGTGLHDSIHFLIGWHTNRLQMGPEHQLAVNPIDKFNAKSTCVLTLVDSQAWPCLYPLGMILSKHASLKYMTNSHWHSACSFHIVLGIIIIIPVSTETFLGFQRANSKC
jgi:hypothetical protein